MNDTFLFLNCFEKNDSGKENEVILIAFQLVVITFKSERQWLIIHSSKTVWLQLFNWAIGIHLRFWNYLTWMDDFIENTYLMSIADECHKHWEFICLTL